MARYLLSWIDGNNQHSLLFSSSENAIRSAHRLGIIDFDVSIIRYDVVKGFYLDCIISNGK